MIELRVEDIAGAYASSRDIVNREAAPAADGKCRYCGRGWVRWPGSKLDGHARCLVTSDFQDALWRLWLQVPSLSSQRIAKICCVPVRYVSAWMFHADRRHRQAHALPEGPITGWH